MQNNELYSMEGAIDTKRPIGVVFGQDHSSGDVPVVDSFEL